MSEFHRSSSLLRFAPALLVALTLVACGDSGPTGPDGGTAQPTVLVLSDGGSEVHVTEVLEADGMTVVDGGHYQYFSGVGLGDADAVVVLAAVESLLGMPPAGEAALVGFVAQGGGMVTVEPIGILTDTATTYRVLNTVVPTLTDGQDFDGDDPDTYFVASDHPVTEGLPATFPAPPDLFRLWAEPKPEATTLIGASVSGAAVVTWDAPGRVVQWNGTGDLARLHHFGDPDAETWNADVDRMLVNAVRYVADNDREYGPIEVEELEFIQRYLTVTQDGDSGDNPGDFYITARLTNETNDHQSDMYRYDDHLVQSTEGVRQINRSLVVTLPKVDGINFTARVSYFENDGPDQEISSGMGAVYTYDAAADCWQRRTGSVCVDAETTDDEDLYLQGVSGSPVDVALRWQVRVN